MHGIGGGTPDVLGPPRDEDDDMDTPTELDQLKEDNRNLRTANKDLKRLVDMPSPPEGPGVSFSKEGETPDNLDDTFLDSVSPLKVFEKKLDKALANVISEDRASQKIARAKDELHEYVEKTLLRQKSLPSKFMEREWIIALGVLGLAGLLIYRGDTDRGIELVKWTMAAFIGSRTAVKGMEVFKRG